jgi:hypothetical protein
VQQSLDAYEAKYMGPEEGLLFHEKAPRPRWWNPVFAAGAAFLASANLIDPVNGWHALAVGFPPLVAAWLVLPILRISVTKKNVRIQLGVVGPTIPVEQIVGCRVVETSLARRGHRRFIYNVGGKGGRLVEIEWRKKAGGSTMTTLVSVKNADELVSAVERARAH